VDGILQGVVQAALAENMAGIRASHFVSQTGGAVH
jgi:hypothetical protein